MPIATITANITGTDLLLEYGSAHGMKRFVFASSVEVYGENRGDTDKFAEDYCGYIDCNTLRAGYPESKRAGEALCQAYKKEKGIAMQEALFYEEQLKKEIDEDRAEHGKKPLKHKDNDLHT